MSTSVALVLALLLLLANGFFVAVEFAYIATQRSQLEDEAEAGNKSARRALAAITDLNIQIAGAQLGITIASLLLGKIAEPSVAKILENTIFSGIAESSRHSIALVVALAFVTFLHILIGEMVPKNMALADPPRASMWIAPIHRVFVFLTRPLIAVLNVLSIFTLRLFGVHAKDELAEAKTPEELGALLAEAHEDNVIGGYDFALLSNTLALGGAGIAAAMVPWEQVAAAEDQATVEQVQKAMADSGHSRLILLRSPDDPSCWVHAKDLLHIDEDRWNSPVPANARRNLAKIPHSLSAEDALEYMRAKRQHILEVVDGETSLGILTLEDVLKVLVKGLAAAGLAGGANESDGD